MDEKAITFTFADLRRIVMLDSFDDAGERLERAAQNLREAVELSERARERSYRTGVNGGQAA